MSRVSLPDSIQRAMTPATTKRTAMKPPRVQTYQRMAQPRGKLAETLVTKAAAISRASTAVQATVTRPICRGTLDRLRIE